MKRIVLAAAMVVALAFAASALAATPTYKGIVGPGFNISMVKPKVAGKIRLVVSDKATDHNFHLTGPGVNVSTSVDGKGTKIFIVTLKKGNYKYVCDPHASFMKGSFTIK
jgi:plastocyanin